MSTVCSSSRGKPLFQNYHTYMYYISLEASFQALFRTVFRLKIFPLEVVFFRSRNVHVWGTCLPKFFDATYFQKNWPLQPLNKHNTYSIWYQSNSYFKLYPELFSNWKYSYNRYLFWFFESMSWMLLDAPICPLVSQMWVMMIISSAKGTITLYNYAPLEDQLSKYFKNLKALKKKTKKW